MTVDVWLSFDVCVCLCVSGCLCVCYCLCISGCLCIGYMCFVHSEARVIALLKMKKAFSVS